MNEKLQSPHPALQALLPRMLSGGASWRPVFETHEEAERFVELYRMREETTIYVKPVWAIDHGDLTRSHVAAWTVSDRLE